MRSSTYQPFSDKRTLYTFSFVKKDVSFKAAFRNTSDNLVRYEVGGIGLKNVKRRLDLLYPGRHGLFIKEASGIFTVELTLETE